MNTHPNHVPYLLETIEKLEAKVRELEVTKVTKITEQKDRWLIVRQYNQLLARNEELTAENRTLKKQVARIWIEGNVG